MNPGVPPSRRGLGVRKSDRRTAGHNWVASEVKETPLDAAVLAFVAAGSALVLSAVEIAKTKAQSLLAWAAAAVSAAAAYLASVQI